MKQIKLLIILFLSIGSFRLNAQDVSGLQINQNHLDLLINTAVQNSTKLSQNEIQLKATEYQRKMVNNEWLGKITIGGNLNEQSIKQFGNSDPDQNLFFPRYNFGLVLPLNTYAEIKGKKKIIEQDQLLILSQGEEYERQIRADVTKLYLDYLKQKKTLNIKQTLGQFIVADFNAMEKKFSEGSVDLDEYYASRREYYNFRMEELEAETLFMAAKTDLEAYINSPLEVLGID